MEAPWRAGGPGATLVYEVEADGFLRKMVRSLVGGLVAAGRGACTVGGPGARPRGARPAALAGARSPRAASRSCASTIARAAWPDSVIT